jgi:putative ABC transport system permease protein
VRTAFLLAWRYLSCYKVRSGILVGCIAMVAFLPLAVQRLVDHYEQELRARADETPLVVGAPGSRLDLLMNSLYFRGTVRPTITGQATAGLAAEGLGQAIPVHFRHRAQGHPLVGTTLDYFAFRGAELAAGRWPGFLGQAVVGHRVAEAEGLAVGDTLLSDVENLYDIGASYPLKMRVTGILAPQGSPDDEAVFVDLKTAWIIEGIGHGHQEVDEETDDALVLEKREGHVSTNAAIVEYTEITPDNVDRFHFHGDPADFPVIATILVPADDKGRTILRSRYRHLDGVQLLEPAETLHELMEIVFQVKRFFDANFAVIGLTTSLLLILVLWLTRRIREREFETLDRIGCGRGLQWAVQAWEVALVVVTGLVLALLASSAVVWAFTAAALG